MYFKHLSLLFGFVLGATCIQLEIPEVVSIVEDILNKPKVHPFFELHQHNHSARSEDSELSKRQGASYWYENIAHQGISAFGPSGYTVYRNVKDYGAKGRIFVGSNAFQF